MELINPFSAAIAAIRATGIVQLFSGERMAQLLNAQNDLPENTHPRIIGAQPLFLPNVNIDAASMNSIDQLRKIVSVTGASILTGWWYTRTSCYFDSALAAELERTEIADILVNREQCSRFLGSPVLVPFDTQYTENGWSILGVILGAYTTPSRDYFSFCVLPILHSGLRVDIGLGLCKFNNTDGKKLFSLQTIISTIGEGLENNVPLLGFDQYKNELLSKTAYLLTETPDVCSCFSQSPPCPVRRRKRPAFLFAPERPRKILLGHDFGEMIRKHKNTTHPEHGTVRPHIRRAHWHTYLSGPGREIRTLKWQPPIFVRSADN